MQEEKHVVDAREREIGMQYLKEFMPAMIGYVVILFLAVYILNQVEGIILRSLVAITPVLPLLFALRAFLRHLGRLDEMQRRIQLHAIGLAAGATGLITFALGMLEHVGLPRLSLVWVFPLLLVLWGLAQHWSVRRYR